MQEIEKLHEDVPSGWVLMVQELAAAIKARRAEAACRPHLPNLPSDLHNLAAPH